MRECLNCKREYAFKRAASKFCSDKCRVSYNRKHPRQPLVSQVQLQVLYNSLLEAVERLSNSTLPPTKTSLIAAPVPSQTNLPQVAIKAIMSSYWAEKVEIQDQDAYQSWLKRLNLDNRLTSKQKELIINTTQ